MLRRWAASVQQEPSLECWNCHAEIPAEDRELIACHDCHYKWRNAAPRTQGRELEINWKDLYLRTQDFLYAIREEFGISPYKTNAIDHCIVIRKWLRERAQARTQPAPKCPKCGSAKFGFWGNGDKFAHLATCGDCHESYGLGNLTLPDFLQFFTALPEATNQLKEVQFALERDRTKVAECLTAVRKELHGYDWLIEGRGCYEWGDDRWHDEFRKASAAIYKAIEPMVKIAADWTNCPMTTEDVKAARVAPEATKKEE